MPCLPSASTRTGVRCLNRVFCSLTKPINSSRPSVPSTATNCPSTPFEQASQIFAGPQARQEIQCLEKHSKKHAYSRQHCKTSTLMESVCASRAASSYKTTTVNALLSNYVLSLDTWHPTLLRRREGSSATAVQ